MDDNERSKMLGEGIAELATDPEGRAFLLELTARMKPSIMDANREQITAAAFRAAFALRAYERTVESYPWPSECTTYGEYFRTLPEDVREAAVADWRDAGLS
ncbi:hypothetical protein [Streptomyces sp. NPDC051554]|uniref:hypothetical protein n=1 Tax=Streptomyces sp. NPDC051554 TaxID=3365656 RepID=UPI00378C6272